MDEKELRKALEIHLDTLRRNLEVVSLEVLKTKYQKPYEELRGQICKAATEYTRHVALCDIRIRHSLFNETEKRMFPLRRTPYCPMTLRFWHWVSIKPCKSAFGFDGTPHTDGKEIHGEKTTKHSQ